MRMLLAIVTFPLRVLFRAASFCVRGAAILAACLIIAPVILVFLHSG